MLSRAEDQGAYRRDTQMACAAVNLNWKELELVAAANRTLANAKELDHTKILSAAEMSN